MGGGRSGCCRDVLSAYGAQERPGQETWIYLEVIRVEVVTEPSNYVVHPRMCVKWEEKGRATKKNGKERQETDHGVRTATKRSRRKRRTVAKAAGAQVKAQDVSTRLSNKMAIGNLRGAVAQSRQQGDYEWSCRAWGRVGEGCGGQLLEQTPSSLLSQGDYLCSQEPPK